jgi:hypothetical protein
MSYRLGIWMLALLMLSGCYEQRVDCLDIDAVNYAVDADEACPDCCIFPSLRVRFLHRSVYPDTVVNFGVPDSVYIDNASNPYRVLDFRFLVSDFRLITEAGQEVSLLNNMAIRKFEGTGTRSAVVINDVLLIRTPLNNQNTVGSFRVSGNLEALHFKIGLSDDLLAIDTASLAPTHPLHPLASELGWSRDMGFDFQRMRFLRGVDTLEFRTAREQDRMEISLPIRGMNALPRGYHVEVDMLIDYRYWLQDIILPPSSTEALMEALRQRATGAFVLADIRYVAQ